MRRGCTTQSVMLVDDGAGRQGLQDAEGVAGELKIRPAVGTAHRHGMSAAGLQVTDPQGAGGATITASAVPQ